MIILLNQALHTHQSERCTINMVREKFALSSQTQGIDTVALKDTDGKERRYAHNHKWHKKLITTCKFGDKENTGKWSMHHARYQSSHTHQGEILLRHINTYLINIPESGKEETGKSTNNKRRSKGSTTSSTTIGCRSGKNLGKGHQADIENQQILMTREKRTVHHLPPLCLILSLKKHIYCRISLTIKRRKKENERTENESTKNQLTIRMILHLGKKTFTP